MLRVDAVGAGAAEEGERGKVGEEETVRTPRSTRDDLAAAARRVGVGDGKRGFDDAAAGKEGGKMGKNEGISGRERDRTSEENNWSRERDSTSEENNWKLRMTTCYGQRTLVGPVLYFRIRSASRKASSISRCCCCW